MHEFHNRKVYNNIKVESVHKEFSTKLSQLKSTKQGS